MIHGPPPAARVKLALPPRARRTRNAGMIADVSRRCFLKSTAAGVVSAGALAALAERLAAMSPAPALGPKSKVRMGKIYLGHERPGWPSWQVSRVLAY